MNSPERIVAEAQQNTEAERLLRLTIGQEAQTYIEQYRAIPPERFAVIKVGGATVQDDIDRLADDISILYQLGLSPVIVHGGGPQINQELAKAGIPENKKDGIRITDEATIGSVETALGSVNDSLVAALADRGVQAEGIKTGVFEADYKDQEEYGYVGNVTRINNQPINSAIMNGKIPVVSCLGTHADGHAMNINGDTASTALAIDRRPNKFIAVSDVPGVLDDFGQVIGTINGRTGADELVAKGTVNGGMIPKLMGGIDALENLPDHSSVAMVSTDNLLKELFTDFGGGTLLVHGEEVRYLADSNESDHARVKELIEQAFDKKLVDDYFEQLPQNAEIYVAGEYRGMSVVLPDESDGDIKQPAYMDKLVVGPNQRGFGIGDELVKTVLEKHPEGVYWRVRKDNPALPWYRSKGYGQEFDLEPGCEWIFFFAGVPFNQRADLAQSAMNRPQTVIKK